MFAELAIPFSAKKNNFDLLPQISAGTQTTLVAIRAEDHSVTINIHDLRPGDVFLFRRPEGLVAGIASRLDVIVKYQAAILAPENSLWRHVGILDDNYQVWDAMPKLDVRSRPLREVLRDKATITIRRPQVEIDPIRLRTSLLSFSNHDYRIFRIETGGHLASRLLARTSGTKVGTPTDGAVICSTFVSHVLRRTTTQPFFRSLPVVVPGDYASDKMFETVLIQWCRIV